MTVCPTKRHSPIYRRLDFSPTNSMDSGYPPYGGFRNDIITLILIFLLFLAENRVSRYF